MIIEEQKHVRIDKLLVNNRLYRMCTCNRNIVLVLDRATLFLEYIKIHVCLGHFK